MDFPHCVHQSAVLKNGRYFTLLQAVLGVLCYPRASPATDPAPFGSEAPDRIALFRSRSPWHDMPLTNVFLQEPKLP